MDCPDLEELDDYLSGEASKESSRETREHLDGCEACSLVLAELEENADLIEELGRIDGGFQQPTALPERVGPYHVQRFLGEGGMGVVYQALQPDLGRSVAVKVMRGDLTDARRVRSFEREVQTLARLKHPLIAVIHGAGRTEAGKRYFAMELVEGMPLDQYLDSTGLTQKQRLQLFCRICEAIDYAHGMGVVHRDLKPANIMVDANGSPKVLDFGLARLLDPGDPLASTLDSSASHIQGTLPYMSPEQARGSGREIGIASDTYSLGVLLHEMLTGTRPLDLRDVPPLRAVQMICEETSRPPSFFRPGIPLDLDIITQKCVRKEASARYSSVDELRRDIVRHLEGRPILARPLSAAHKIGRFVARRRALSATLFLLLVTLVTGVTWQSIQSAHARDVAARATNRSEFLQSFLLTFNPQKLGRVLTTPKILEAALGEIDGKFAGDPEGEADVRLAIGRALGGLGREELALEQLQMALTVYRSLGPDFFDQRADCMGSVAQYLERNWQFSEAEQVLFELREMRRSQTPPQPEGLAGVERALGGMRLDQGLYLQALEHGRSSLKMLRALTGDHREGISKSLNLVGQAHLDLGEYQEGLEALQECFDLALERNGMRHAQTLVARSNVANAYGRIGDLSHAEEMLREILELEEELLGLDHLSTAHTAGALGVVLAKMGLRTEAETLLRRSTQWFESAARGHYVRGLVYQAQLAQLLAEKGEFEESAEILARVVAERRKVADNRGLPQTLNVLGRTLFVAGLLKDAESAFSESYQAYVLQGLGRAPISLTCRSNLASVLAMRGRSAQAEELFREFVAAAEESSGPDHVRVGVFRINLTWALRDQWKSAEAAAEGRRALAATLRANTQPDTLHVAAHVNIAMALLQSQDYHAAQGAIDEAFVIGESIMDETNPLFLKVRHTQATCWLETGEIEWAAEEARELLRLREENDHPKDLADSLVLMGRILAKQGEYEAAEKILERGVELRRGPLVAGHWSLASVDSLRGECLLALGRFDEAEKLLGPSYKALTESLGESQRLSSEAGRRLVQLYEATARADEAGALHAPLDAAQNR